MSATPVLEVLIIGAGFGGIGMGIRLRQEGVDDFLILERGDDIGGVWRDNTYPGAACDVPSVLYSFSFAPNPEWSCVYPPQPEIHAYLHDCAEKFDLNSRVRTGATVADATSADSCSITLMGSDAAEGTVGSDTVADALL